MPAHTAYDTVHEIAVEQHGLLKATQATDRGVAPKTLVAMAARGRLERVSYGVYRDRRVPENRWTPYMAAALWPYGTTVGLLIGETVLGLLDLSDVNPAVIHIAVPTTYRIRRRPPPPGVMLHHADVPAAQRTAIEGIPATTVDRAIRDCAQAHLGPALLHQAIADARTGGWLTPEQERELINDLTADGRL
jgi:predicted transcriptional regulator of viral defense system